jgi:putative ABC transport system substrate-binding protein
VTTADIRNVSEIEQAIAGFGDVPDTGMIVFPHPLTIANRASISALAARRRLPTIYPYRYFVTDGGLVSYGPDQIDQWRGAGGDVGRIIGGGERTGLPVQAPVKYEMVINRSAAKAIELDLPAMLLARADEVID